MSDSPGSSELTTTILETHLLTQATTCCNINKVAFTSFLCKFVCPVFKVTVSDCLSSYLTLVDEVSHNPSAVSPNTIYCTDFRINLNCYLDHYFIQYYMNSQWYHLYSLYSTHSQIQRQIFLNSQNIVLYTQICYSLSPWSRAIMWEHAYQTHWLCPCVCVCVCLQALSPLYISACLFMEACTIVEACSVCFSVGRF